MEARHIHFMRPDRSWSYVLRENFQFLVNRGHVRAVNAATITVKEIETFRKEGFAFIRDEIPVGKYHFGVMRLIRDA